MSASAPSLFTAEVIYQLPFFGAIKRDIAYGEGNRLLDIYYPEDSSELLPVVIFVTAYPDAGFKAFTGVGLREVVQYQCWAKLAAASGIAAITCSNEDPVADPALLIDFLRKRGKEIGIDGERIGIWACSSNVPNALALLQNDADIRCAVFCYGYLLDLHGAQHVADAARTYHFANPAVSDRFMPAETPLLLVRAGRDQFAGINLSIDAFVQEALLRNCRLRLINYVEGVHAFDVLDRSTEAVRVVQEQLAFLRAELGSPRD